MIVIVKNEWKVRARFANANTNTCRYANIIIYNLIKKYTESDRCTMPHQCIQIRK